MGREVLDIAAAAIRPGITTDQIDAIVHEETIKRDAYPSPLNYRHYPKSVCTYVRSLALTAVRGLTVCSSVWTLPCSSINEIICHGIPDQRKLQEGDIINIGALYYLHAGPRRRADVASCVEQMSPCISTVRLGAFAVQYDTTYHGIGFHTDLNETYPVGRVDDDSQRLMRTARKCLDESIKQCRPGALFRDLGKTM